MTRRMLDFTSANFAGVKALVQPGDMVAWYGTGSAGIDWTPVQVAVFAGHTMVEIDQGYGSFRPATATVRDVESGAWTAADAVKMDNWTVERPTIYCDRSAIPEVTAAGWHGDIWLAWPGWQGTSPPVIPGCTVVAVQNEWMGSHDTSVVFDPYWPLKATAGGSPDAVTVNVTARLVNIGFSTVPDAGHYVIEYVSAPGKAPFVLGRPPQPASGTSVAMTQARVPDARGGAVTAYAIVGSKPVLLGTVPLP